MVPMYKVASKPPHSWEDQEIDKVIDFFLSEEVNARSSPGVPWTAFGSTNKMVLDGHRNLIVSVVKARLFLLASEDCRSLSAEERVRLGFCDPVRLFVKNEPHGSEKSRTKRWRIIMSVSLVDQLVERVLNSRLNKSEVKHWQLIPSKGGSSMYQPEDVESILEWIHGKDVAEADVSGFDWSVKHWELMADAEFRARISPESSDAWRHALFMRVDCLSLSVFSLSDGRLIAQRVKGIQKSGSYNTTPTNSHIRVMLALLVGSQDAIAVGDDGLETYVPNAPSKYAALGHPLKMYQRCVGKATFCSMCIHFNGQCEPETWSKTFFRFLDAKRKDPQRLYQLNYVLANSPHRERILRWIGGNIDNLSGWTVSAEIIREIISSLYGETQEQENSANGAAYGLEQGCELRSL